MNVEAIRPTQFTLGLREVAHKEAKLSAKSPSDLRGYIKEHPIEGVLGLGGEFYATDGHHFGRAALNLGIKKVCVKILKDYSHLELPEFWQKLEQKGFTYLFAHGRGPLPPFLLPRNLQQMTDDPYRSLASYLRRAGGFHKSKIHFAEFFWADFFRKYVNIGETDADFTQAVDIAYVFAKSELATGLPGYAPEPDKTPIPDCLALLKTLKPVKP